MDFCPLLKICAKVLVKKGENVSGKYSQNIVDYAKNFTTDAPKIMS